MGARLCPYAHRVWWALTEKGVDFEYIHIDLGKHKPTWYQSASVNRFGSTTCPDGFDVSNDRPTD